MSNLSFTSDYSRHWMILKKKYGHHFMDDIFEVASVTQLIWILHPMKAYRIHVKEKGLKVSSCAATPGLAFVGVQGQHKGHFETSILDVFPP